MDKKYKLFLLENKFQYNFMIYQIGYEKCKSDHRFGPCIRDFYVFHFVVSGRGYFKVKDKVFELKKGDGFLVPAGILFEYYAEPSDPYEYYWVGFNGVNSEEILQNLGFLKDDCYVRPAEDFETMKQFMVDLCDYDENVKQNYLRILGDFYKVLGYLSNNNPIFEASTSSSSIMKKLMLFIENNYADNITVENMAEYVNLHRSNVYRLFKCVYNTSPQKFLADYRIDRALYLLKNSQMSIKEIAYATGFSDPSYFCKMFKKKHLKTPQEARKLL